MSRLRPTSRRRPPLPRLPAVRPPHRRRRKLYRRRGGAHRHGTTRARIDPLFCPTPPLPSSPRGASAPVIYTADWTRPDRSASGPGGQPGGSPAPPGLYTARTDRAVALRSKADIVGDHLAIALLVALNLGKDANPL